MNVARREAPNQYADEQREVHRRHTAREPNFVPFQEWETGNRTRPRNRTANRIADGLTDQPRGHVDVRGEEKALQALNRVLNALLLERRVEGMNFSPCGYLTHVDR